MVAVRLQRMGKATILSRVRSVWYTLGGFSPSELHDNSIGRAHHNPLLPPSVVVLLQRICVSGASTKDFWCQHPSYHRLPHQQGQIDRRARCPRYSICDDHRCLS